MYGYLYCGGITVIVVSLGNLKDNVIEIAAKDKSFSEKLAPEAVADRVQELIKEMMAVK